jgi:hypothetical protein
MSTIVDGLMVRSRCSTKLLTPTHIDTVRAPLRALLHRPHMLHQTRHRHDAPPPRPVTPIHLDPLDKHGDQRGRLRVSLPRVLAAMQTNRVCLEADYSDGAGHV